MVYIIFSTFTYFFYFSTYIYSALLNLATMVYIVFSIFTGFFFISSLIYIQHEMMVYIISSTRFYLALDFNVKRELSENSQFM